MNGDKIMEALGYVECNGLASATVAADRMLKTSDVELSRIRNADNGWITLEFTGDISSLKVAVETVKQTLTEEYVAGIVLGSPADGLNKLGNSGASDVAPQNFNPEKYNADGTMKESAMFGPKPVEVTPKPEPKKKIVEATPEKEALHDEPKPAKATGSAKTTEKAAATDDADDDVVTCNLCGDPKCPRKMGEPHVKCIHYNDLKKK